jgi:hypothetical protein
MSWRALLCGVAAAGLLSGCGGTQRPAETSLGRTVGATRGVAAPTLAPVGDPLPERGGTISPSAQAAEQAVPRLDLSPTPRAALRRYALLYVNWRAAQLPAHERELARISAAAARLEAAQVAASASGASVLAADHVADAGSIVAIAPGEGAAAGQWVVVTREQITGTGPYAGLPDALHVTLAQTLHETGGWVVSAWTPQS